MSAHSAGMVRALALTGATGSGKTTLLHALLTAAGALEHRAGGAGEGVGDTSPEARARGHSVELNLAGFSFMDDRYAVIDCPGSVEFSAEADFALPSVDLAVVVADPEPDKAVLLQPTMKALERLGVPHLVFVNRIDQARGSLTDLLTALAPVSSAPLVARQIPIWQGERVSGFVDLALERAFVYRAGQPSERIDLPPHLAETESESRFHMLEQLADFDDDLMEQLLTDAIPDRDAVFADLVREMNQGLIVPVFMGSAQNGFGVRRLLKALRHELRAPNAAAERLGVTSPSAYVIRTAHAGQTGKLTYVRVLGGKLSDGAELTLPSGERARIGGLFAVQGPALKKIVAAEPGDVVAIGKIEHAVAGDLMSGAGKAQPARVRPVARPPLYALAVTAKTRGEDVRLSGALAKLVEEDPGLRLAHDVETHEVLLQGQGEGHVRLALERLKRKYGLEVSTNPPATPYKETIAKPVTHHARHKKQSGGHGQFGDVTVEIAPQPRGAGFSFAHKITGGVVPKQWIQAVEQGARDALGKGPLGFPVVDVAVTLIDGGYHSVDSSEMAFRAAGRLAMEEGMRRCGSCLLEPIEKLAIYTPNSATSHVTSLLSARRGQILGLGPREGWPGWDRIEAYLPRAERLELIGELRSVTQGLGAYEADFGHMAELTGRLAEEVTQKAQSAA
jgi:elongation factor G